MVTALMNNNARASIVSFGKGTCVLMQPNTLVSATRHVASRPIHVSQPRSASTDARNRSRSGGGVERVTAPRGCARVAAPVGLRVAPRLSRPLPNGASPRARTESPHVTSLSPSAAGRSTLRSCIESSVEAAQAGAGTFAGALPTVERTLRDWRLEAGGRVERELGASMRMLASRGLPVLSPEPFFAMDQG